MRLHFRALPQPSGCLTVLECVVVQVLNNPDGTDHGNIRNFIEGGWKAVIFPNGLALTAK